MRFTLSLSLILVFCFSVLSQRYRASESMIRFFSDAPLEDIEAISEKASSIIDLESGQIVIAIPIRSFDFEKELMEEHFNENYLESDKYPRATFRGKITNWNGQKGKNPASAEGELEIHGVKQPVNLKGSILYEGDRLEISTIFTIKLEDYDVDIPKAVFYKIAEEVEVTANLKYAPYEKN